MSFEVLLSDADGEAYDISELVSAVEVTDSINKVGCCTFSVLKNDEVTPAEGNAVRIRYEDDTYFVGYIFDTETTHEQLIKVTAYDQLYYLQTEDTYVFPDGTTLSGMATQLCGEFGLRVGELEETGCNLGRKIFDGKKLLDIITDGINLTLTKIKEMYYIKDEGGYVVLRNIRSSISDLLLDPESLLYGYSYKRSISDGVSNQIKLVRDNKETGKRELYVARDSGNIKKWGLLQYYEKLDDEVNPEQAKQKADALLQIKNRVKQTLSLDALGETGIRAGNLLCVKIPEIGLDSFLLCTSAKHSFSNTAHTVKADLRLI